MVFVSTAPSNKFHFYFFTFPFSKCMVFFKVNLLIGANACVRCQKSLNYSLFCNSLFEKWKSLSIRKFALWNLRGSGTSLLSRPSFPFKYRSVKKLGGLLLISSHLWSSQSLYLLNLLLVDSDGFPDQSRSLIFFFYLLVGLWCLFEL